MQSFELRRGVEQRDRHLGTEPYPLHPLPFARTMHLEASITGSLVTLATNAINDLGLWGIAALVISSAVIGIPGTEVTMLFAGFSVSQGHLSMGGVIAAGVAGDLIGATIAYVIGYKGLHELLARAPGPLHVSPRQLQRAHAWFDRFGAPVITVSRLLPLLRAVFPYAAGVAEMPYLRFIVAAAIGSVIWIGGLASLGRAVGSDWSTWRHYLEYVDYAAAAALLCLIGYLLLRRERERRARTAA
jgi:membrane protein DedA with SNARE-associated domain